MSICVNFCVLNTGLKYTIYGGSDGDIQKAIKDNWDDMPAGTYNVLVQCGNSWCATVVKNSNKYGSVLLHSYALSTIVRMRILNGTWSVDTLANDKDFGKITVRILTKANDFVKIEGAPTTGHYIPVIIGHSIISNCFESIFWDTSEWRIASNYAQYTTINFYKYPL